MRPKPRRRRRYVTVEAEVDVDLADVLEGLSADELAEYGLARIDPKAGTSPELSSIDAHLWAVRSAPRRSA